MNKLDERLRSGRPQPGRPLRAGFTDHIISQLDDDRAPWPQKRRPQWKEYIQMKFHRPVIVTSAFVAALAVGGTAYAAVGGIGGIRAFFAGQQATRDGGRVIQVGTQACPRVDAFNITDKNRTGYQPYYVRVKPGSSLTNQQIVSIIQGVCEADAEGTVNSPAMQQVENRPENKGRLIGGYADSVITAVSADSLTIRSSMPYHTPQGPSIHTVVQTFRHIDPAAVVINQGKTEPFGILQVGDHISITYRMNDPASAADESQGPDKLDPDTVTIAAVTRLSQAMQDYFNYSTYQARDFEQVTPCSSNPSGYCNIEQYLQDKR